jgi:hypothetical protein
VPIVDHSAIVAVAIDDAFGLSQSYGLRLEWDPFVKSQRLLNGATVAGKGVQTLTLSRHGLRMVSEYLGREIRRRLLAFQRAAETPGMIDRLRAEIAARHEA